MKDIIICAALGVLGGASVLGMIIVAILSMKIFVATGGVLPYVTSFMFWGGVLGGIFGAYKAGLRLRWE